MESKPLEILLVEDERAFADLIERLLQARGMNVTRVENGMDGAKVFAQSHWRFDLVISDVQMPELNGVQFLKFVRTKSNIPFIVMTGSIETIESESAHALGATEFLSKPIKSQVLLDAISHSLLSRVSKPAAGD